MAGWDQFLFVSGGFLFFAFLIWLGETSDRRRWKRERAAAEAAQHPAE